MARRKTVSVGPFCIIMVNYRSQTSLLWKIMINFAKIFKGAGKRPDL